MNISVLKTRLIKEIDLVPENRLPELYKIILSFTRETEFAETEKENPVYHDSDHLLGKWREEKFHKFQVNIDMPLSLEEKLKIADTLYGSWAEDNSLKPVFEEIEQQRHSSKSREANLEISS